MDKIQLSNHYKVKAYNRDDYFNNNKQINDDCLRILSSYEGSNESYNVGDAYNYISDLNSNMYLDELDALVYIMYLDKTPVSFAIYTKIDKSNSWVLELIFTHEEYTSLGYAGVLLRASAGHLKEAHGAEEINSNVNYKNAPSMFLNNSFAKVKGVNVTSTDHDGHKTFHFDIRGLSAKKVEDDAENILC